MHRFNPIKRKEAPDKSYLFNITDVRRKVCVTIARDNRTIYIKSNPLKL